MTWTAARRRKPLIVRGARQVGKTWLVENVAAARFDALAKVDLEKRRDLHVHFGDNLDPKVILRSLELDSGTRIVPGRTLLFLDEIQACPRAIMALRYFHEQMPELHVIAAGSLLEFALGEISVPVGRVQYLHLYPMTFREYLLGIGNEVAAEVAARHPSEVDDGVQRQLLEELKTYFFVGGMPETVRVYRDTGSLVEAFKVQTEIIGSYREDFAKYTPRVDRSSLDRVLLSIARQVGEQIKYTRLDDSHAGPTNRRAFELLCQARVIHKVASCDPSGLPLGASANEKRFKAAMLDIGLLQNLCQVPVDLELREEDLLAMYRGKLAEQFVAQELIANHSSELFYWAREARGSNAEVDYLAIRDGRIARSRSSPAPAAACAASTSCSTPTPSARKGWFSTREPIPACLHSGCPSCRSTSPVLSAIPGRTWSDPVLRSLHQQRPRRAAAPGRRARGDAAGPGRQPQARVARGRDGRIRRGGRARCADRGGSKGTRHHD